MKTILVPIDLIRDLYEFEIERYNDEKKAILDIFKKEEVEGHKQG